MATRSSPHNRSGFSPSSGGRGQGALQVFLPPLLAPGPSHICPPHCAAAASLGVRLSAALSRGLHVGLRPTLMTSSEHDPICRTLYPCKARAHAWGQDANMPVGDSPAPLRADCGGWPSLGLRWGQRVDAEFGSLGLGRGGVSTFQRRARLPGRNVPEGSCSQCGPRTL